MFRFNSNQVLNVSLVIHLRFDLKTEENKLGGLIYSLKRARIMIYTKDGEYLITMSPGLSYFAHKARKPRAGSQLVYLASRNSTLSMLPGCHESRCDPSAIP